jgi:hypothetical protein
MNEVKSSQSKGFLNLLGLDTLSNAVATFLWTLPHLAISLGGLGLISWLVERYLSPGIPMSGYLGAMALAAVVVFFTLALMRGATLRFDECSEVAEEEE